MTSKAFWINCAAEILFSHRLSQKTSFNGRMLKKEAISTVEHAGLAVNKPDTAASWAITTLIKEYGFLRRVKTGEYVITAKGDMYRHKNKKDELIRMLVKMSNQRSKEWRKNKAKIKDIFGELGTTQIAAAKENQSDEIITIGIDGLELKGSAEAIAKVVAALKKAG